MQRVLQLAILALVFWPFVCQAQTSPSTATSVNRFAVSDTELDLEGAGAAPDVVSINGRVKAGFEFLRRMDNRVVREFAIAWQSSGGGITGREGVVLIFRMADGGYRGVSQGASYEYHRFSFGWRPNAVAIVHTHPNNCDPKPSPHDEQVAEKYHVPIFTITLRGMYVYNPATRITSKVLNDLDWLKLSKWRETDVMLKGCLAQSLESCNREAGEAALLDEPEILRSVQRVIQIKQPPLSQVDIKR